MKVKEISEGQFHFFCPACREVHTFDSTFRFNGDFKKPTISPAILFTGYKNNERVRCHCLITDGKIRYLQDCSHLKRGKVIELKDF